jgi:hypothetical protein
MIKKNSISFQQQTAEVAIERIELLEKIRNGSKQSEEGKVVSKEQAKKRLKKWLK